MKRLLGLVALLAAAWLHRRLRVPVFIGFDRADGFDTTVWTRRTPDGVYHIDRIRRTPAPDPADAIQVDPSLHERAGL